MKKTMLSLSMAAALFAAGFMAVGIGPAHAASGGEEKTAPEFEYYQVPAVVLPVITEKGLTQQVSLAISLELPFGKREKIAAYGPRLVDAYIRGLFAALSTGQVMMRGNVVDVEKLKARLSAVTENVLGEEKANLRGVLLQAVQQHQI